MFSRKSGRTGSDDPGRTTGFVRTDQGCPNLFSSERFVKYQTLSAYQNRTDAYNFNTIKVVIDILRCFDIYRKSLKSSHFFFFFLLFTILREAYLFADRSLETPGMDYKEMDGARVCLSPDNSAIKIWGLYLCRNDFDNFIRRINVHNLPCNYKLKHPITIAKTWLDVIDKWGSKLIKNIFYLKRGWNSAATLWNGQFRQQISIDWQIFTPTVKSAIRAALGFIRPFLNVFYRVQSGTLSK